MDPASPQLHKAVLNERAGHITRLLAGGHCVNETDAEGWTALHHAACKCKKDICLLLIDKGADVAAQTRESWTPLHFCAQFNMRDVAEALLNRGADKEAQNKKRRTALHTCANHEAPETAEILLLWGANKEAVNDKDWTPLHFCARKGTKNTANVLLTNNANKDAQNKRKWAPLHICARYGSIEVANALLDEGAEINAADSSQSTALHVSAKYGKTTIALALLEKQANVDACDAKLRTALHTAAEEGHVQIVRALLENGADRELRDEESDTALHLAVETEHQEVVVALLEVNPGSIVNIAGSMEQTPLHAAVFLDHVPIARALLAAGAWTEAKDNKGRTPCECLEGGQHVMRDLLLRVRAPSGSATGADQTRNDTHLPGENNAVGIPSAGSTSPQDGVNATAAEEQLVGSPPQPGSPQECDEHHVSEQEEPDSDEGSSCCSYESEEWTAENPFGTRGGVLKKLESLKNGDTFADNYVMEMGTAAGKRLVRCARQMHDLKRQVFIEFYWDEHVFDYIQAFHSDLDESAHVWRILQCLKTERTEFPPSIVFERGTLTLEEWLRDEQSSVDKKRCLCHVLNGLKEAHGSYYVHGDLKPANISFFGQENKWKLTNWDGGQKAGTGRVNPPAVSPYSAPEVIKQYKKEGQFPLARQALDIWSFGIIAYETLSGQRFFEDDSSVDDMVQSLADGIVEEKLRMMEDSAERESLSKCLDLDSKERWSAAEALAHCLFAHDDSTTATQSGRSSVLERSVAGHHSCIRMCLDNMHISP